MDIKEYINNPFRVFYNLQKFPLSKYLPDEIYIRLKYHARMGKKLNLNPPVTFNEKLQWLKLHDHNPQYTTFVDKYEVRQYIADTIGEEYLIPLIGVWNSFDEIDFSTLPDRFVLKCTHDSGSVVICKDKSTFDYQAAKMRIENAMKKNFYYQGREWPYKDVKPRIIAEKYMENSSVENVIEGLVDYKVMCFGGQPRTVFTCTERFSDDGLKVTFFDNSWKKMPFERKYPSSVKTISKPSCFEKMMSLSMLLSRGIPFVRVDWYELDAKLYFGELTLFPGNGFESFTPNIWDQTLGDWINISSI